MTRWLNDAEQHAWRGLLQVNARLRARLNRGLQASSGLSMADYDVLVALTDVEDRSLRMGELGRTLDWEKSRVSRQVGRMEDRGLVVRRECPDDGRGTFVDLTEQGREAIEAAAPDHVALVRTLVFDGLTEDQVAALGKITTTVLERIEDQAR